jgi:glycosyltransferase involved in cell wall biosynthesis
MDRRGQSLRASLVKAKEGRFSHLKLPVDRPRDELLANVLVEARALSLGVVAQVSSSLLGDCAYAEFIRSLPQDLELEILLDGEQAIPEGMISALQARFHAMHFSILVHKQLDWEKALSPAALRLSGEFHLYFPYQLEADDPFITCAEAHRLYRRLKKILPNTRFLPPKGTDLWDKRVKENLEMEPFLRPCFETSSASPQIKYSVVIPTYNNQNHLRVTIRHLLAQDVGPDAFEIIVVDDGGTDQTQSLLFQLMRQQPEKYNFKYLFFPRAQKRSMGDAQFRAGIARNLGVKNAVGEILCFLDSDIVTPPDYLREVGEKLKTWDALQARRTNLKQKASHLDCEYSRIAPGQDTEPDEPYWESFVKNTTAWHEMPYNWKYVCTHSFSLRRDLFWRLGGFKRNFIFYGFEDTDLGYRLTKSGYHLHLLGLTVYHLYHEVARSEFMNLKSFRHNLLSRTAQIFYLHHLDDDIFHNLRGYMDPEPTFRRLLWRARGFFTLSFLWRPRSPVQASFSRLEKALIHA